MEQNVAVKAKRFWKIVRAAVFMLGKGISKSKRLADVSTLIKLGKLTGKAILHNLVFNHWASTHRRRGSHGRRLSFTPDPDELEFSCSSNSPAFPLPFKRNKGKREDPQGDDENQRVAANVVVKAAIKMLQSETASPGFGRSPRVRWVRVTDSPYPLKGVDDEESRHVDEAADMFIQKFYKDLMAQNATAWDSIDDQLLTNEVTHLGVVN